jgi:hypothetical protein
MSVRFKIIELLDNDSSEPRSIDKKILKLTKTMSEIELKAIDSFLITLVGYSLKTILENENLS